MNLKEYFGSQHGIGVLSTADAQGRVDAAVPSRYSFQGSPAFRTPRPAVMTSRV